MTETQRIEKNKWTLKYISKLHTENLNIEHFHGVVGFNDDIIEVTKQTLIK